MLTCSLILLIIFILLYFSERRKARLYKRLHNELTEKLMHFLIYPKEPLEEDLEEGEIYNLWNQVSRLEKQYLHEISRNFACEKEMNHFIENMAHQMKTAVTALQIRLDMALLRSQTEEEKEALEKSQECLERLIAEIERILKSSQLAEGKIQMNFDKILVIELVDFCVIKLQALAISKNVIFRRNGDPSVIVYGDYFWLQQALENLLKNAIEHSKENGEISILWEDRISEVILRIEDQGEGIEEKDIPRLFERFYRGKSTKSGYGIGLSMTNDIVKIHHGILNVGNRVEGGSWFEIRIPLLSGSGIYVGTDTNITKQ